MPFFRRRRQKIWPGFFVFSSFLFVSGRRFESVRVVCLDHNRGSTLKEEEGKKRRKHIPENTFAIHTTKKKSW